ncbi:hypothetical protein APA_5272 [Pseudanabaena sp. lw0831]|nr:hypothetical protein APA_5272 [Pseudanabaena sp. lw0831]
MSSAFTATKWLDTIKYKTPKPVPPAMRAVQVLGFVPSYLRYIEMVF